MTTHSDTHLAFNFFEAGTEKSITREFVASQEHSSIASFQMDVEDTGWGWISTKNGQVALDVLVSSIHAWNNQSLISKTDKYSCLTWMPDEIETAMEYNTVKTRGTSLLQSNDKKGRDWQPRHMTDGCRIILAVGGSLKKYCRSSAYWAELCEDTNKDAFERLAKELWKLGLRGFGDIQLKCQTDSHT
tara:strand:- start:2718 stop:3281 length:564 start_codon:yes stop_codon:yes gene_type:complete